MAALAICTRLAETIRYDAQPGRLVPNLANAARQHGVSRRAFERVRAKMRRMGLIDHVSRFSTAQYSHMYRTGAIICSITMRVRTMVDAPRWAHRICALSG